MDEYSVHLMFSCCNQIKACGIEIDYVTAGYTSKLQVRDLGVNKPFKGYVCQEYEKFLVTNNDNRKVCRENIDY